MMKDDIQPAHYLAYLGVYSLIITITQSLAMEIPAISEISTAAEVFCYIGFMVVLFIDYSIAPYFFLYYGATLYNISLLTCPLYGLIFSMALFHQEFSALYFIGYILVMIGILLFNYSIWKREKTQDISREKSMDLEETLINKSELSS